MPFVKGQRSANPWGRPKTGLAFAEMCRGKGPELFERMLEFSRSTSDPQLSLRATEFLIERGYGRAPQSIEVTGAEGGPLVITWQPTASGS